MYTMISTHTTPLEAHIVRGRLEAEGVPGFVLFEHHIWAKWSLSQALGGVRLYVPSEMAELAIQANERIHRGEYESVLIEQQGISKLECPKCGSTNNGVHSWLWKLALVFMFTISFVIPYTSHLYSCDNCKHSWIAHDQRPYPLLVVFIYLVLLAFFFYLIYIASAHIFSWQVPWV